MSDDRIDPGTADHLLSGRLDPQDAPPGFAPLAALVRAASLSSADESAEDATVAAMLAAIALNPVTPSRRKTMLSKLVTAKALAAAGVAVLSAGGVAAAASGSLPGPVQDIASHTLDHVGVNVPTSHGDHDADTKTDSTTTTTPHSNTAGQTTTTTEHKVTYGLCVAEDAHDRNGAQPNSSVFPSDSQCSKVTAPGNSADHRENATTTTTMARSTSTTAATHGKSGDHRDSDATTTTTVSRSSTTSTSDTDHGSANGTSHSNR